MPSYVVVVKCPTNQDWLFNQGYAQICDYLIFDLSCNAVILCELKKTFSENRRNKAFKQIMHTKNWFNTLLLEWKHIVKSAKLLQGAADPRREGARWDNRYLLFCPIFCYKWVYLCYNHQMIYSDTQKLATTEASNMLCLYLITLGGVI